MRQIILLLTVLLLYTLLAVPVLATSTEVHIVKYAHDGTTILAEKTLTYQEMESTLPVMGDGATHFYLQGPVFVDDPDTVTEERLRWNPDEDTNVQEKDVGAVKGTDVRDLCNLVGGMRSGETLKIRASDGMMKEFAYKNIYTPPARQGAMVITWYKDGQYPDSGYFDGMRLVFFADTSVNPWGEHVFGNLDWHESAEQQYWYYYQQGSEKYPTTTGLSVKYVSDILIYSTQSPGSGSSGGGGGGVSRPITGTAPADDAALYGYRGSKLSTYTTGTLNGTIHLLHDPNSTPGVVGNRPREYSIPLTVPSGTNLTMARLYVYLSKSFGIQTNRGIIPSLQTRFNEMELNEPTVYIDTDGDGRRNVSATYAYNVLPYFKGNNTSTVSLRNLDSSQAEFSVEDVMLLVAVEDKEGPSTQYWIGEGCDVILSDPRKGILPEDATTSMAFGGTANISGTSNSSLIMVSTGIDSLNTTEHKVKFNNGTWYNAFDSLSAAGTLRIPVKQYLNGSGNSVSIQSTIRRMDADYLVNRNAILVIEQNRNAGAINEPDPGNITPVPPVFPAPLSTLISTLAPDSSSTCRLTLHSNPEGALIFVDGSYLGKTTPYVLEENPGDQHTIRFELEGFVPVERNLTVHNDTLLCENMYSEVHSTKGRSDELVQERDLTHHGSLYVNSRPSEAIVSIDGIVMSRKTPAIIYGLKEGPYTVRLSLDPDPYSKGGSDITFEDQEVYVYPYGIVLVDVAANTSRSEEIILDSRSLRGEPVTVNGRGNQKTIPSRITVPLFGSFVTVYQNQSYVSYPIPAILNEDHYVVIEPRRHFNLSIFVDSTPGGAEVFIDGFRTGFSTPYTFANISDGSHRITVSKPGYVPEESVITLLQTTVPMSTTNLHFILEEYPSGFLRVVSDALGSTITINGIDTGEVTPFLFPWVPTGTHAVTVINGNMTRKYPDVVVNSLVSANISAVFHEIQD